MSGFADVLKSIGYGAGAVTGGPSQVKALAGIVAGQNKIDTYLQQFGKTIGAYTGYDLFEKIGAGAKKTSDAETQKFVSANLPISVKSEVTWIIGGLLLIVAYFFYRGRA